MGIRVEVDLFVIGVAQALERLLADAGPGHGGAEQADDGGALRAPEVGVAPGDDIGGDPALAVRRAGQRHEAPFSRDEILDLDGVAHGEDIRIAGAHPVVDADAAARADFKPGRLGQHGVRAARRWRGSRGRRRWALPDAVSYLECVAAGGLERGHAIVQRQLDAVLLKVGLDGAREFLVGRQQNLPGHLHDRHLEAAMDQVLGHLQADEAAAHNHARGAFFSASMRRDAIHSLIWRASGTVRTWKMPGRSIPGSGGRIGRGARRQHQLVVGMLAHLAGAHVAQPDLFLLGQNFGRLAARAHIDGEAVAEHLRGCDQEARLLLDDAADMVGQPAIRVGNVRPALHHQDFGALVEPAKARGTGCAAGHSTYDDDFHGPVPFFLRSIGLEPDLTASRSFRAPVRLFAEIP